MKSKEKLAMIYDWKTLRRISIREVKGEEIVTVDVHGLNCFQADRLINNVINIIHKSFHLIIIHGYRHGTAIKRMLFETFENPHILYKYPDAENFGMTHMELA